MIGICFTAKVDQIVIRGSGLDLWTQLAGIASGLGAAISQAIEAIILRRLKSVHHTVIMFIFSWIGAIEMALITYLADGFHLPECGWTQPWLMMSIGLTCFTGQVLYTKALQVEEAGIISMVSGCQELILAFIFQITIFREVPGIQTIIGATLVLMAILFTGLRKYLTTLPGNHCLRKVFAFVMK